MEVNDTISAMTSACVTEDGVRPHWAIAHQDAPRLRLDCNGMSVAVTGDAVRHLTSTPRLDFRITEVQVEVVAISASVNGVLPVIARTPSHGHNPVHAAVLV